MRLVVSSRVMCEWVNRAVQAQVGRVTVAADMGHMKVSLLWEGAYSVQCLALMVFVTATKKSL
jgi:hypothetical protein